MLKHLIFAYQCVVTITVLSHAQIQSDFISLDCGLPENSDYRDRETGINYVSDANFIETGEIRKISSEYISKGNLEQHFFNVRSFPEGVRNCYTIKLARGYEKFLLRARFMYGNYDGKNRAPSFNLTLEADVWDTIEFDDASSTETRGIIHTPQRNYLYVCLVNIGSGTPFISLLEIRPLPNSTYKSQSGSLLVISRVDFGPRDNKTFIRYPDDNYDRIWDRLSFGLRTINSSLTVGYRSDYQLPSAVMNTAIAADDQNSLEFYLEVTDPKDQCYFFFHFAEIEDIKAKNQTRELNIYVNNKMWSDADVFVVPDYLYATTVSRISPISADGNGFTISINKTENSTLPPILNAMEIYQVKEFPQLLTEQQDVSAILNIKSIYGVKRDWQGDPCVPRVHLWQGVNCSYDVLNKVPRIISLNLSSGGMAGPIAPSISNLSWIRILDLSNNSLNGTVPEFLSKLPHLRVLNLEGNQLQGSIPADLQEKMKKGLLSLSVDGNSNLLHPASHTDEKYKFLVPVTAVVSLSAFLTAMAILWSFKRRKQGKNTFKTWRLSLIIVGVALLVPLLCYICYFTWRKLRAKVESIMNRKKLLRELGDAVPHHTTHGWVTQENDDSMTQELKIFNFQTIVVATNNFSTRNELGKGGFGSVYKGELLEGQEIAIKRLSKSSGQGVEEFKNEAKLIAKLQHKNLVRLLGCSLHGEERILVYEYLPNKSLDNFIFDSSRKKLLDWKKRFNIIEGVAQGLLYLHNYSRLRVIHRDLKASNVLLDDQMNPKISDFGMARVFGVNESEANTNRIVGTYGYMSPEYAMNGVVSTKTDVFSFGILVLEIVSGEKNNKSNHTEYPLSLAGYAWQMWNEGKGLELKDPTMEESCSPNEVMRCIHVGLLCVQDQATDRPTMSQVVSMLANEAMILPAPKQPAFFINVTTEEEAEIPGNRTDDISINHITLSAMEAR